VKAGGTSRDALADENGREYFYGERLEKIVASALLDFASERRTVMKAPVRKHIYAKHEEIRFADNEFASIFTQLTKQGPMVPQLVHWHPSSLDAAIPPFAHPMRSTATGDTYVQATTNNNQVHNNHNGQYYGTVNIGADVNNIKEAMKDDFSSLAEEIKEEVRKLGSQMEKQNRDLRKHITDTVKAMTIPPSKKKP